MISVPNFLLDLRKSFQARGKDIRYVGGCVRDTLVGKTPKDFDLCTDATPDEQIDLYRANGLRYIETGLAHGTVSVVDQGTAEVYEITSLRIDTDCDGRHAQVEFTSNWHDDMARRDLTMNAMSLDFDGNLFDPFDGQTDLDNGVVRFVGSAEERIREDYLRILRFFRFLGRFGSIAAVLPETKDAIRANAAGLRQISVERVWSEMSRILVGPQHEELLGLMVETGVAEHIGFGQSGFVGSVKRVESQNPITQLVAYNSDPVGLSKAWKMSLGEQMLARFLHEHRSGPLDYRYELTMNGVSRKDVAELAALRGDDISDLDDWVVPTFPVTGKALLARGHKPGKQMGDLIRAARTRWAESGYTLTGDDLLMDITYATAVYKKAGA